MNEYVRQKQLLVVFPNCFHVLKTLKNVLLDEINTFRSLLQEYSLYFQFFHIQFEDNTFLAYRLSLSLYLPVSLFIL